ncbi:sigma-70 family RNA polymerase sigma factor [Flagellimonas sp. CMM7]|uniref:sigma-70 family RNA polymerase sigma factor n=1 Tax=Flagellimonas sp. CMM7 TaxID=2654676 RepID=UPI0013D7907C|nr:sigma-70 family RNA polymerase sigma factor [Flagellimonas sp. CMM7]UII80018.1 sigma-70 family RNA polymerase sigma factor [Flagellimonas sp. CMM7]
MLEEYVINDKKYRAYAYKICGCNELKHDLVNEMYLKLHSILENDASKEITDGYIYMMLKSIFLNQIRDNKEYIFDNYTFEAIDDSENLMDRMQMNEALGKLTFLDREVLLKCSEKSIRQVANETGIHYLQVYYQKQESLEKLKEVYG